MKSSEAPVISIMTVNPVTIRKETSTASIKDLFKTHKIRHLPVLNEANTVIGMVSISDLALVDRVSDHRHDPSAVKEESALTAGDLMTSDVLGLAPDDSIGLAADIFLSRAMHAAPVLDEGELIGIVTSHDLLRCVFSDVLPLTHNRAA